MPSTCNNPSCASCECMTDINYNVHRTLAVHLEQPPLARILWVHELGGIHRDNYRFRSLGRLGTHIKLLLVSRGVTLPQWLARAEKIIQVRVESFAAASFDAFLQQHLYQRNLSPPERGACTVITYIIVWINRVRLPILLAVSWTGKMNIFRSPFAPKHLVSRDGSDRPVPRQPAHSPYSVEAIWNIWY